MAMRINNIGYLIKEGIRGIFLHGFMSFAAVCVTVACLLIVGTFSSVVYNVNQIVEDLNMTKDQIFADAMGSNFTIYSFSPLATLSTTGGVIGASKWLKDVEVVSLTHGLAEGVDPEAGTTEGPKGQVEKGQTFSIQAVKNFGYKFVKWIDASGATVSEDPILTVVADKDQAYYAVFEAVNVYKLSIDVVGGGKVTVSTPGKDGEYEYYEEGTVLYLTAHQNKVTTFLFWQGDNDFIASQPEIELTINISCNIITILTFQRSVNDR